MLPSPSQQMTHNATKKKNAKFYTVADETALLKFLTTRKASAGMNFSQSDWNAAATTLNRDSIKTDAELRTFESCKAKYRQLKSIYDVVNAVRSNSGWKWDDEKGADITPANKGAWDEYIADHPKAASFRNKGWVHLALFDVLGGAPPKGIHVFRASQDPSVAGSSQPPDTQGPEEREDSSQFRSQTGGAPLKGLHVFRTSQGPSVPKSSKPADTQGPDEREDSPPPRSQSQVGEAPHKGLHVFRTLQGPSVAGFQSADTPCPEEREGGPQSQSQAVGATLKGLQIFRASQDPSVPSSSKPADTQVPEEREGSPPAQSQSQTGKAPPKGLRVVRASQGPIVAGSSKLVQRPEEQDDSPPWVTIESESQSQAGEENGSNDEGKLSPPLAIPAPSKRKRVASATTRKKPRVSASAQAFGDLTAAFHHTATVIEKAFETNVPTSLKRKTDTMKLAIEREKDWLTKRQMALLLDIFEKEPLATEGYQLVQDDDELRREWICVKLNTSLD